MKIAKSISMRLIKPKYILIAILVLSIFLRFYRNDLAPVSLFGDELDLGYQAYSFLHTGRDYAGNFMPIHFHSLADYRTPLYLYAAVPTVALFGITPLGVRTPAAFFGVLDILFFYLLIKKWTHKESIALLSAFLLCISPWHLQYSRAGFEVTQMMFLLIGGIYFFHKGLEKPKWLILSAVFLALTPWSYNTAKLYLVVILVGIVLIWFKELLRVPRRPLMIAILVFAVIAGPFAVSTVFGGGAERFNYLSIFSNPTLGPEIGFARERDRQMTGIENGVSSHFFHNKIFYLTNVFTTNYLTAFSTKFLFIKGDPDIRQSIQTMGEFYKFEFPLILIGLFYLTISPIDKKYKYLFWFWLLTAPIPSSLTVDGGGHATRLMILLPPLIFLAALGVYYPATFLPRIWKKGFIGVISICVVLSFAFYLHDYWIHYPWDSQRWWDAGYKDAIQSAVSEGKNYDKVIISDADEPSLIYFLGWSQYSPELYQKETPLKQVYLDGFGTTSKLGKYYFTPQGSGHGLYEIGGFLKSDELYLATEKEIRLNLIEQPGRVPDDLKLVKAISYPSGEPAFYLFAKAKPLEKK